MRESGHGELFGAKNDADDVRESCSYWAAAGCTPAAAAVGRVELLNFERFLWMKYAPHHC